MSEPLLVDQGNIELFTASTARPSLLEFWAPWCAPCLGMGPAMKDLASALEGRMQIGRVDIEHSPGVAARFGVVHTPTLIFLVGGQAVAQITGFQPASDLRRWVQQSLKAAGG